MLKYLNLINWNSRSVKLLIIAIELIFLTQVAWNATEIFHEENPDRALIQIEGEWLTHYAYTAAEELPKGNFPTWQTYLDRGGMPFWDSPFSFLLNPFSIVPSLIYGWQHGIKMAVVIAAIIAGWGGWAIGKSLDFGVLARLLLGVLMIGKGSMVVMVGQGYFQLGTSQAYLPWVIAFAIFIMQNPSRRWAVVGLGFSLALTFLAGSIWYSLPAAISVGLLAIIYLPFYKEQKINWKMVPSMAVAGLLGLGLSAAALLPAWYNRDFLGAHFPLTKGNMPTPRLPLIVEQLFNNNKALYEDRLAAVPELPEYYMAFVTPLWFAVLIFFILPYLPPFVRYVDRRRHWRIWVVGIVLIIFHVLWASSGNEMMYYLLEKYPKFGEWRFTGRALGVAAIWLAILLTLQLDNLWKIILDARWYRWVSRKLRDVQHVLRVIVVDRELTFLQAPLRRQSFLVLQIVLLLPLTYISVEAAQPVLGNWDEWARLERADLRKETRFCVEWLRENREGELSVYHNFFFPSQVFVENEVRLGKITADYEALPEKVTIGDYRATKTLPNYGLAFTPSNRQELEELGYEQIAESPIRNYLSVDQPCLWYHPDVPGYAYTVPLEIVQGRKEALTNDLTSDIAEIDRDLGTVILSDVSITEDDTLIIVQETAFPGWEVHVDGEEAQLESVGGYVGILLDERERPYTVEFAYRPPLLFRGLYISGLSIILAIAYLFRVDLFLWRYSESWRKLLVENLNRRLEEQQHEKEEFD